MPDLHTYATCPACGKVDRLARHECDVRQSREPQPADPAREGEQAQAAPEQSAGKPPENRRDG